MQEIEQTLHPNDEAERQNKAQERFFSFTHAEFKLRRVETACKNTKLPRTRVFLNLLCLIKLCLLKVKRWKNNVTDLFGTKTNQVKCNTSVTVHPLC